MPGNVLIYLVITTLSAACGLVVEIAAGRMIAPYLGMSLYSWTAIIAVVLAGFSVGHWIGGLLAERSHEATQRGVAWSLLLAGASTAACLVLIRLISGPVIGLGFSPVATILIITSALFFLPSLFVGIPSPALTKLAIDATKHERLGRTLGMFYAASALGSIAGTLAAGYLFISWLGTIRTFLLVASVYLALAAILFFMAEQNKAGQTKAGRHDTLRQMREKGKAVLLPLIVASLLGALMLTAGRAMLAFTDNCQRESDYYCIRVVDVTAQVGVPTRTMVLDHLGHGINLRYQPRQLITPYVALQDRLARYHIDTGHRFRSFFIGGGAYTLPRAWLDAIPNATVTVAEVDPAVTEVAISSMWFKPDARITIRHEDARRALARTAGNSFEIIIGDAFHDITVPQHLVTVEFFRIVASRLSKNGIYLMNVVDHADRPRLALSVIKSLRQSFPVVELWRAGSAGGKGARATLVIAGLKRPTQQSRISLSGPSDDFFQRLPDKALSTLMTRLKPIQLSDDYAPVDRLIGVE